MVDDTVFMKEALKEAQKALAAGEFPVGCVLVSNNEILATGSRTGTLDMFANEVDHAEMVALRRLAQRPAPADHSDIILYSTLEPCLMCFAALILGGIGKIVYAYEDVMGGGTGCDLTALAPLYKNSRVSIKPNVLRKESLALFKAYFSDPETTYWNESLLSTYTLGQ